MRKLIYLFFLLPHIIYSQSEIDFNNTIEDTISNLLVNRFTKEPINGEVFLIKGEVEIYRGSFHNGLRDGEHKEYHENKNLKWLSNYKDGIKEGPEEMYFENGNLQYKGIFKSGKLNGPIELYYENRTLSTKGFMEEGIENGDWEYYYENGNLKLYSKYSESGKEIGVWKVYDSLGSLIGENQY